MVVWISMQLIMMNLANVDITDGEEGACIPYATGCTNPNACNSTTGVINDITLNVIFPQLIISVIIWMVMKENM